MLENRLKADNVKTLYYSHPDFFFMKRAQATQNVLIGSKA